MSEMFLFATKVIAYLKEAMHIAISGMPIINNFLYKEQFW